MTDITQSKAPNVTMVACVDDTALLGSAPDVTRAISETLPRVVSNYTKPKRRYGHNKQKSIDDEPLLRTLQGRMGDKTNGEY